MSRSVTGVRSPRGGFPLRGLIAVVFSVASLASQAAGLNDTGETLCYTATGVAASCGAGGQDARYGRDAAAAAGLLPKVGAGSAGFDYTKVANNGSDLPASAALGANATDWACTRDNLTGLVWEVKIATSGNLRYTGYFYSWYSTAANNGGDPGYLGTDSCSGTLSAYANQCNTTNYISAVNAAGLCSHNDWRLPTLKELQSLVNAGNDNPSVDAGYFPSTQASAYWTSTIFAPVLAAAWSVDFGFGSADGSSKVGGNYIRLVRGGP